MFGLTLIKKQKLRRLALDYQTQCLQVKRLKQELEELRKPQPQSDSKQD